MSDNRPVNLSLGQVLSVNLSSPVAVASILHRVTGVVLFALMPLVLWMAQQSLGSAASFDQLIASFDGHVGFRFVVWLFVAALLYHLVMGAKHLLGDFGVAEGYHSGRISATVGLVISALLILASFVWVVL